MIKEKILSRIITHPNRIEPEPQNQGIALLILNSKNQFLLVREAQADESFGRRAGHWNIVTEKREDGELVKGTVIRGLKEELDKDWQYFEVIPNTYRETNGVYTEKIGYYFKFRCCAVRFLGDPNTDPNLLFKSVDGEIDEYMWSDWQKLHEYDLEEGAKMALEYYGEELGFIK